MPWVEFHDLLWELLATPRTRLWRRYAPKRDQPEPADEGGDDL